MNTIKNAEAALEILSKELKKLLRENQFSIAIGIDPNNGKYTIEITQFINQNTKHFLKAPPPFMGFKVGVSQCVVNNNE